ncbi:MAG: hypothetical protein WKF61_00425 [Luteimonas sp.]
MHELQLIQNACTAMPPCTSEMPYLLMAATDGTGSSVAVDIEWVSGDGAGPDEVRMSVTERVNGDSQVLLGVAFNAASGDLLRGGESQSLARPITDDDERARLAADLAMILALCQPVEQGVERAAA